MYSELIVNIIAILNLALFAGLLLGGYPLIPIILAGINFVISMAIIDVQSDILLKQMGVF